MPGPGASLGGIAAMGGGLLLCWTAIEDPAGGPVGALKSLLQGKPPTAGAQTASRFVAKSGEITPAGVGTAASSAVALGSGGSATRAKIIATAQSYLGVRYVFGGASRSGVDCSGLVLLAYKSVGIDLPHKATLQAAKGRRIDRSAIKPGDLVAWGAPGNFPHIALAMNTEKVIVAPHTGSFVMYQDLWQSKVPGYGKPLIYRILGD